MSLGGSLGLIGFMPHVCSQVPSSRRQTQARLVFALLVIWPNPPAAGSVAGHRQNSFLVDEGCRVTFGDRLARRHCLLGLHRRLLSSGLCPASCDSRARIEMRCWGGRRKCSELIASCQRMLIESSDRLCSQVLQRRRQFYRQGMYHAFGHCT